MMELYHRDMTMMFLHNDGGGGGGGGSGFFIGGSFSASSINNAGGDKVDAGVVVNTITIPTAAAATLKKGPWTAGEDAILTEYVRKHGDGNWNAVMRNSGLAQCGKSCRLRWANHLRPNLKKGSFSNEEERLIVQLHAKYGNKWARMAAQLPGRTDNEVKNYWNTRIKRRQRQGLPLYPPDIQPEHPQAQEQHLHSQKGHVHNNRYHPYPHPPATTTASSFSFHTQLLAPSPPPTTTTTPPPTPPLVSQTPPLPPCHSAHPSPCHNYSTWPLFDPFLLPRNPSLLASSFRFRRHSLDTIANTSLEQPTTTHQVTAPFSLPSSPILQQPDIFQFTHSTRLPAESTHSVKAELPSNQLLSQNENSDLTFDTKVNPSGGGSSGLLDDLLEEAHTLSNGETLNRLQEENRIFNGFDTHWNNNPTNTSISSEGIKPKTEPVSGHDQHQMNGMHEDLSKFSHGILTQPQQTTEQWYSDSGEFSNGQSSVITDENLGLEMQQHMASLFPGSNSTEAGRIPAGSCSWDNMPGIC